MLLTIRALALLLSGAVILAAASLLPGAMVITGLYYAAMAGLLLADLLLSPRRRDFQIERRCHSKLSLAAQNPIHLRLVNLSSLTTRVWLRDEFPPAFEADRWVLDGSAPADGELSLTYHLKPNHRGDFRFGSVNLRYRSRLGLLIRQAAYPVTTEVKVYPNLLEMRRYDLLTRHGRLYESGVRNVRLASRGTDFQRLREYQPDDDYRRINWKATARRGQPISMEYEPDRSQNVLIALDCGRLMGSPVGRLSKLDYAVNTALMLAYVAVRNGDNVGLLAFADQIDAHLPPRRGKRQFLALLDRLYALPAHQTETDYDLGFRYLATHCRKRSLVVLFTDLIDVRVAQLLVGHLARLSRHHVAVCVSIADPGITAMAEAAPRDSRLLYRKAVAEELLGERKLAVEGIRRTGAIALDMPAERLTAAVVARYLEIKAKTSL